MEKATHPPTTCEEKTLTEQQHFWLEHVQTCLLLEKKIDAARCHWAGYAIKATGLSQSEGPADAGFKDRLSYPIP